MGETILAFNAGSSSIKFAVFAGASADRRATVSGKLGGIGVEPRLIARDSVGRTILERGWPDGAGLTHEALLHDLLAWLESRGEIGTLDAVSHRVVHGGLDRSAPARVTPSLLAALEPLSPLAPLHQPHTLAPIRIIADKRPDLPQIACFDTAFHHDMPAAATRFALPRALEADGIRRFGFHGLSYEYVALRLHEMDPARAGGRAIAAHLGNGASLCAMRRGRSVETSMGFSTLDGLVMGTRCGALDPGVLLYLLREKGMSAAALEHMLYERSGLLGVSGISSDMTNLLANDDPRAADAIELFTYRAAREAGAMAVALEGLDTLVFTGGIGENAASVREDICRRLAWLGIALDARANRANAPIVSAIESRIAVYVIPANEEWMLADHARALLGRARTVGDF